MSQASVPEKASPRRERIFCNTCKNQNWHNGLFEKTRRVEDDEWDSWWETKNSVWICCGCEAITFRIQWESSEDREGSEKYFPTRNADLASHKLFLNIPYRLNPLYSEVIDAFNTGSLLLCAGGLRALLEGVCVDKGITEGPTATRGVRDTLEGKINGLKTVIPSGIADKLHAFRFLGNDALHELVTPKREDLALAIEIIEDVLGFLYELDYKTTRLYQQVKRKESKAPPPEKESA